MRSYNIIQGAVLVLPLILLYKLWSGRRSSSNDETNNGGMAAFPAASDDFPGSSNSQPLPSAEFDSSDSSLLPSVEYEVFLSFRGPDTRHQITDTLFRFLVHLKIHTFKDDDELRKGEGIWPSLVKAIGQSKIYVPILSKSYAHSKWCLKELVEIVENMRQDKRRIILPIFYMVDPRDVRHQSGPYQDAFREHEKNFDQMTIQNWRAALNMVGTLKGWHVKDTDGCKLYEVQALSPSHSLQLFSKHAFKKDSPPPEYEMLSNDIVSTMGGLPLTLEGTEQVKAIKVKSEAWEHLQLGSEYFVNLSRLRYFKANNIKLKGDFDNLLPNLKWLALRHHESSEGDDHLINLHMKNLIILDLRESEVSNEWGGWTHLKMANKLKILNLSSCLALTRLPKLPESGSLEVLDLSLFNRDQSTWEDELDIGKLKNLKVLRFPFACIKKITGGTIGTVMKGLRELDVEMCQCENLVHFLVDVEELQSLRILRTSSATRMQGTHQQLLTTKPSSSHLKVLTTSCPIVDLSQLMELEELGVEYCEYGLEIPASAAGGHSEPWWKTSKLKTLRLYGASRMWCSSSGNNNPSSNCRLPSALTKLYIGFCFELEWVPSLENLENLVALILDTCPMPREIQGLGGLKSLQTLRIFNVDNLRHLDGLTSDDHPSSLAFFQLERCGALERLPSFSQLREVFTLHIIECPHLTDIPSLGCLLSCTNKLQELYIRNCPRLATLSLTTSSVATESSSSLQRLVITGCTSLLQEGKQPVQIPHLSKFPKLTILYLEDMRLNGEQQLTLEGLECLTELVQLRLGNLQPSVERLPSFSNLGKLHSLEIADMPSLREIEGFGSLRSLAILQLTDCTSLERIDLSGLVDLEVLNISRCPKLETAVSSLPNMEKLGSLEITDMPGLRDIEGLANLKSLQRLDLRGCTSLERLPPLEQLTELGMVNVEGCTNLADRFAAIGKLPAGVMIYQ
ncbi:unnamed protein product [Linum tenue]|uniref:TIR domain-containing protein n=1 Tax=Linum tenue TaxID=586396 RepID=A0AAV0JWC4_9ROSI|nr:unnamed protein product [Linum tenue]